MKEKILKDMKRRDIKNFIHFTRVENLEGILRYGLLTRAELDKNKLRYIYNDYERYDNVRDSVSLSIRWTNYSTFYKMRMRDPGKSWAVLLLRPELVLDIECAYNYTNAASNKMRYRSLESRCTYESYEKMFNNEIENRNKKELESDETTDHQAEILALGNIPVKYIQSVCFETLEDCKRYQSLFKGSNIHCGYNEKYFNCRHDYTYR